MTPLLRQLIIQKTLDAIGDEPVSHTLKRVMDDPENNLTANIISFESVLDELEGFGPLKNLFERPYVTEILVNGWNEIYFEEYGVISKSEENFSTPLTFERFINRVLHQMERVADVRHPLIDGTLSDGTRVHVALPPASEKPYLSLRRHNFQNWKLEDLFKMKMFNEMALKTLRFWVSQKKSILICGPTGSGKTTLLRAMLHDAPANERIITLEDTPEIGLNRPNAVSLFTRQDPEALAPPITLQTLLVNSLRMRPDRIVVGEVRGAEALLLLDALSTGHKGSMSSIHASSPQQGLRRLESLVSRGAPQWPMQAVRQLIFDAVDIILVVEKQNGLRVLSQAAEISGLEDFGFLLTPLSFA